MRRNSILLIWLCTLLSLGATPVLGVDNATNESPKKCFQCNGMGVMKCPQPGCKGGQAECPGACLRLTRGNWNHMEVAGHSPSDLWITFQGANGNSMSWNQNHVRDVIKMQNGEPVNTGTCPVCGGTTKVKCSFCKGTGEVVCSLCEGKKVVPQ